MRAGFSTSAASCLSWFMLRPCIPVADCSCWSQPSCCSFTCVTDLWRDNVCWMQSNLAKQLAKLVKVKYVEDISAAARVGKQLSAHWHACGVACYACICMSTTSIHLLSGSSHEWLACSNLNTSLQLAKTFLPSAASYPCFNQLCFDS